MPWQTRIRRLFGLGGRGEAQPASQDAQPVREEVNLALTQPPLTEEDMYWGRMAAGTEEDYLWRRLSDNWYMKDVQPIVF